MATNNMLQIGSALQDPTTSGGETFARAPVAPVEDVGFPTSSGSFGDGTVVIYTMRALQNGTTYVYWENESEPDLTGTGENAPSGTLTDIGVIGQEIRAVA